MISGYNMGDNMFIYCYVNIGKTLKLDKNRTYEAVLYFDVATMMQKTNSNITEKIPAQSVVIKAGIMPTKPEVTEENGIYKPNFLIGHYMTDQEYIKALGNIQKVNYKSGTDFEYKTFDTKLKASTDDEGNLYLIIGIDSYYIGPSWVFIDNIKLK
jgi:DNA polymerase sigma